ncbi:MAG: THUMP domain-containing protein [Candidatus Cloacimonetes bacterium]|nr:THUMP domain-containing protein [Candidatus Cloacimonadota bacterium]MCB5286198.1 THUMP domain-containing protein [Candidatus Cloacimonadota bacterium]MCK9184755.1 THUMP domain-containing protein [Candidatus Cloacimonadota bacterium]MDY0228520.1 THUMP domain-containing protein [Candidatus Cloacimonadaceae bacterium]
MQSRYFAVVSGSLEKHAKAELESFGAIVHAEVPRGLIFSASTQQLYRLLYGARLVQRVLFTLLSFDCHSHKYLYQQAAKNIDWPSIFSVDQSFGIICNVSNSFTRHSLYSSQKLKDAICDSFRARFDARPSFTTQNPDILFNLHIHENRATIALDILGLSMHKRGYRQRSVEAPMQETLAAAIVKLSGWDGETPLWDPMCGSGTLLAEAAMHYCRIPAGYLRDNHRVKYLPDFDEKLWEQITTEENEQIRALPKGLIRASDINPDAIKAAQDNLRLLPHAQSIDLSCASIERAQAGFSGTIITNPPYGVRLGPNQNIIKLYNDLGDFLKQKCKGSTAYVLCGDKELVGALRLRAHWSKLLKNADLDTRLAKIVIR